MTLRAELTVGDFDALSAREAAAYLESCCGSPAWVAGMLARRPFGDLATLLRGADEQWWSLSPGDWMEAFAHHPRIGERDAAVAQGARARAWSAGEQGAVVGVSAGTRATLAEANREYERRFGHIYLVAAAGKSAEELLAILRSRLSNDPETELRVAAGEQAKITQGRLRKLLR